MQTTPRFNMKACSDTSNSSMAMLAHAPMAVRDMNTEHVRWEKVLTLRAAIARGRYSVSSKLLAEKLLEQGLGSTCIPGHGFDGTKEGP